MDASVDRPIEDRRGSPVVTVDTVDSAPAKPKTGRLSVNVTPATQAALDRIVDREGITMTEAVRRLVGYGDLVYETTQINRDDVLIRRGDITERIRLI